MKNTNYTDNYFRRLIPFYTISIILHLLFLGGSFAYSSIANPGNDFRVTTYVGGDTLSDPEQRLAGAPHDDDSASQNTRVRLHRVDYFNTVVLENPVDMTPSTTVPEEEPVVEPPQSDDEEASEDVIIDVDPDDFDYQDPLITEPRIISGEPPPGQILTLEEIQEKGELALAFPAYEFEHIPYNPDNWDAFQSTWTHRHDVVYFIVDISRRGGFDRYFEWAEFWDYLLSLPGVQDPPTPIGVAVMIEDPYYWTIDVALDAMKNRIERTEYNIPIYKKYNFIDVDNQILNGFGIEELEKPVALLVDWQGYVRLKLEGNIEDMPLEQTRKALSVIKELWGMSDFEANLGITAIISYQQKIIREKRQDN